MNSYKPRPQFSNGQHTHYQVQAILPTSLRYFEGNVLLGFHQSVVNVGVMRTGFLEHDL